MKYVLDASVALKWVLSEDHVDKALLLRREFESGVHEFIAPDIFPVEVGHALSKAHRQRRITKDEADAYYLDVLSTLPQIHASLPLLDRAYQLALDLRTRVYDCLYVALAEENGCSMVTGDQKALNTFQGFPVVDLSQL